MTRVRPAREEDTDTLRETHVAAIEAFGPEAYDERTVAARAERDDESLEGLHEPDTYWVVAERDRAGTGSHSDGERDDRPSLPGFGHLDLGLDADDRGEIAAVYVHPAHARSGVGSAVLAHLEGYARGRGVRELTLTASRNAVGFYERAGYRPAGEVTLDIGGGEVEIDCVEMEKRL